MAVYELVMHHTATLSPEERRRLDRLGQRFKLQERGWTRQEAAHLLFVRFLAYANRTPAAEDAP